MTNFPLRRLTKVPRRHVRAGFYRLGSYGDGRRGREGEEGEGKGWGGGGEDEGRRGEEREGGSLALRANLGSDFKRL